MPLLLVPFWCCCCCCWEKAEGPLEVEEGAGACAACVIRCHAACSNSLDHGASSAPRVRAAAPLATRRISAVSSVVVVEVDVKGGWCCPLAPAAAAAAAAAAAEEEELVLLNENCEVSSGGKIAHSLGEGGGEPPLGVQLPSRSFFLLLPSSSSSSS